VAGELDQQRPDASGGGLHHDGLTRADARATRQPDRGAAVGEQRHGIAQRHLPGNLDEPLRGRYRALGVAAGSGQARDDAPPAQIAADARAG
jgi:hypothetical protein